MEPVFLEGGSKSDGVRAPATGEKAGSWIEEYQGSSHDPSTPQQQNTLALRSG
jgi:hypothetical protein